MTVGLRLNPSVYGCSVTVSNVLLLVYCIFVLLSISLVFLLDWYWLLVYFLLKFLVKK
jgi:hypothetical protein